MIFGKKLVYEDRKIKAFPGLYRQNSLLLPEGEKAF